MLDPAFVRDHIEEVRTGLRNRGLDPDKALEEIATLETARRRLIPELEGLKRQQNTSGDEIARAKRQGQDTRADSGGQPRARAADQAARHPARRRSSTSATQALLTLPNLPHASVPVGKSAADNVEVRRARRAARVRLRAAGALGSRARRSASSTSSAARKIAGARFSVLSGAGARLRAR